MVTETTNSILSEPETSFEQTSGEVKETVDQLAFEDTQEAHDEIMRIAKDHGVNVIPEMSTEEIKEKINEVL